MSNRPESEVLINTELDIVAVRKEVRQAAAGIGFGVTDVTRIVTAASELARNIFLYANPGAMRWCALNVESNTGIQLRFEDHGAGIADIEQAMTRGYTTSKGLGMGLPGAQRLMGELEIQSEVGKGTIVTARKWLARG